MDAKLDLPRIVSADDHVMEPPTLWQDRLPRKYLDDGPRVVRGPIQAMDPDSVGRPIGTDSTKRVHFDAGRPADIWLYESLRIPIWRTFGSVGMDRDDISITPMTYDEMRKGCYDREARLADMDANSVDASLCYPNMFVRFCGQTFSQAEDKDLAWLCVKAYNDWMIQEWAGPSGGRLIPLTIIPLWDVGLAVAEVERTAGLGSRAVAFSEIPSKLGLPSIHSGYWDPFFAVCQDTGTVINMHFGSASAFSTTSDDAPAAVLNSLTFLNPAMAVSDWVMSGLLLRFPGLKIVFGECNIGWLPYLLERMDIAWGENRGWTEVADLLPEPPSEIFRRQVHTTVFRDSHGMSSIGEIGVDNVMFEVDYPHTDSTWPGSMKLVEEYSHVMPAESLRKVVRGNAIRVFGLDLPA
ncbi:MAG TPA: amidohydrolase family protein [Acidimicrobiales bacterium]|jgi:predicted TIM-barrel fold metal-dependent hydrolase|nr:amidohydrolase family protein [Acidimicrobiales bacterium]